MVRMAWVCMAAATLLMATACQQRDVGRGYARQVVEEATAATKTYLARITMMNPVDSVDTAKGDTSLWDRKLAAEASFSHPRLLSLAPCSATLSFSYQYDGLESEGAVYLRYDPARENWTVEQLYLIQER